MAAARAHLIFRTTNKLSQQNQDKEANHSFRRKQCSSQFATRSSTLHSKAMVATHFERRRSRKSFQKTLETICARLTDSPKATGRWKNRIFGGFDEVTVEATALWVAGSFARGASNCGDLDLVLEYETKQGSNVGGRRAAQALFKSFPDVRVYGGSPEKNESGVAFPEAVLIWNGEALDWRSAIAAIQASPQAKRFSRATDRIPFRTEQVTAGVEELDEL